MGVLEWRGMDSSSFSVAAAHCRLGRWGSGAGEVIDYGQGRASR